MEQPKPGFTELFQFFAKYFEYKCFGEIKLFLP